MSDVVAPSQWEEITLPNPSISSDKWHFTENDKEGIAKLIELPGAAVAIFGFLLLFGRVGPFPELMANGIVFFVCFIATLVAALVFLPKVSKRVIAGREKKRDEYRAQHAHIIIDALNQHGWKILGKDAVKTIVVDNNPNVENADGVRYYARQIYFGREEINVVLTLSDPKAEQAIKDAEKQKRINFEIGLHERKNGPMTPEAKEAFVAALNIAL